MNIYIYMYIYSVRRIHIYIYIYVASVLSLLSCEGEGQSNSLLEMRLLFWGLSGFDQSSRSFFVRGMFGLEAISVPVDCVQGEGSSCLVTVAGCAPSSWKPS